MKTASFFLLKLQAPDRIGLLASITELIAKHRGNLVEVQQYTSTLDKVFFGRLAFEISGLDKIEELKKNIPLLAQEIGAQWTLRDQSVPLKTILLVSKTNHCLADLLWRWRSQELNIAIQSVISNHEDLRSEVEREGLPFHYFPIPQEASLKEQAFQKMAAIIRCESAELLVMCRYMQVLPAWLCEEYRDRIINIHHSLLPAFAGADPYRQAYNRGVKLIGATCHYATEQLDAGPIIHQEVLRIEHFHSLQDIRRLGRDCEKLALARGIRFHADDRVLVHDGRSIVFGD
ncbi:MAG: formyltetrahydrofolate deformylase [Chthoniobacterales bacterium]|nr:formyltetrahydrofolate deformylase [Chthoniobacterales bacterium]